MHPHSFTTSSPVVLQIRCTFAFLVIWLGATVMRLGLRTLHEGHPARTFASSRMDESIEPTLRATGFTQLGAPVKRGTVVAWTAAIGMGAACVTVRAIM